MPTFTVLHVDVDNGRLLGTVSTSCHWDGSGLESGDLHIGEAIIEGRWTRRADLWIFQPVRRVISEREGTVEVMPSPESLPPLGSNREFDVWDGYWGERAELVLDRTLKWEARHWTAEDQEAHDHRHCIFCWANIDGHVDAENCFQDFFDCGYPACPPCYRRFVEPRSLDFTPIGGPDGSA